MELTWILPIIELCIISFAVYNVRRAILGYKKKKRYSFDFFTTLKRTCYEILPKFLVIPVVTEIAVFYYGFIYWKKRELKKNEFSYHKDTGTISLLIGIIIVIAIETVAFHFFLLRWSSTAAWILTFVSIYSGVQIFGFLKSIPKRPISIYNGKLFLRYGIMSEATIDLKDIDSIDLLLGDIEFDKETRMLSFLGELESHNVVMHLKEENTLTGLYGIKRKFKNLVFHVDDVIEFHNRCIHPMERDGSAQRVREYLNSGV